MQILRMESVKAVTGHKSHASIYNAIKEGLFTRPCKLVDVRLAGLTMKFTQSAKQELRDGLPNKSAH